MSISNKNKNASSNAVVHDNGPWNGRIQIIKLPKVKILIPRLIETFELSDATIYYFPCSSLAIIA